MPSWNQVQIAGHLGKDAMVGDSRNGSKWAMFSVAVTEKYKTATGEWKENTYWITCKWFGCYENVADWLTKGRGLCVFGSIATDIYEKDGRKINTTFIKVEKCWPVDGGFSGKKSSNSRHNSGVAYQQRVLPQEVAEGYSPSDDDVPF